MPQQSLFGGFAVTGLSITLHLNANGPGGTISASCFTEFGERCESQSVRWTKDRDITDLGMVVKAITEAWLWGEHGSVSHTVALAPRAWLPEVPLQ